MSLFPEPFTVAKKCVLIGYGTKVKGYHLYDPCRDRILYIRDIKFNESEFGLEKEHDESELVHCVECDCELKSDGGVSNCGILCLVVGHWMVTCPEMMDPMVVYPVTWYHVEMCLMVRS